MTWTCDKCEYSKNEDNTPACVACTSLSSLRSTSTSIMSRASSIVATSHPENDVATVIVIELPAKQKLGVKLMPPKNGVICKGLSIDNIDNPVLDGRVAPGDLIVAIGGESVDNLGFGDAIELIRKMPRPLAISFEIVQSRRDKVRRKKQREEMESLAMGGDGGAELPTYAVVFEEGPMGLNLEDATRFGIDGAVVKAVKGQAQVNGMISIGDIVCNVNETDVLCMSYTDVMQIIRDSKVPRTVQFIPKDHLADVQRLNSRHSEPSIKGVSPASTFPLRDGGAKPLVSKYETSARIVKDVEDESKSIQDIIRDNKNATIKKGTMFKQSRIVKQWKARYFVLSVSKLEFFKSPSSTSSRGELEFLHHRCTVRDMPGVPDMISKSPAVPGTYLLEVQADEKKLIMACTSETEKKAWMDALKLAIDASRTIFAPRSAFTSGDGSSRLSQFDYDSFPTPVLHVTVVSATNLAKAGSTVNAMCEVTLNAETFKTTVIKNQRSPEWKQDNTVTFEANKDDSVLEVRVYDEHGLFRSSELLSTLTVPLKSLPNMQKIQKEFPLVLGNRAAGAVLSLSFEYVNKAKEFRERHRSSSRGALMGGDNEIGKLKAESQQAADDAVQQAREADEEAKLLLAEANAKAEKAEHAARAAREEGRAAVEAALQEAEEAKKFAERQGEEAKRKLEEAKALIAANERIQEKTKSLPNVQYSEAFLQYRKMLLEGTYREDDVRKQMKGDGIGDVLIDAFFADLQASDLKIKELQAEVEKLKSVRKQNSNTGGRSQQHAVPENLSNDQAMLLRRLLIVERQLQKAGIAIAEDIPYEEAKAKVDTIARRMGEIGSADVTHPDPAVQKQLRDEYFKLEQDMEKYNTALMLTDEFAAEEERKEREWEEENYEENVAALKAIRRMMPVDVASRTEAILQSEPGPSGLKMPRDVALKFKRTNVLQILRINPQDLARSHPSVLENLRVTGLSVTERRALHLHLKDIALQWESQKGEEMANRRLQFFKMLKDTFKTVVASYNRHVAQYGPKGQHPYLTRGDESGVGCPLIGKQCPLKADAAPAYELDLGYPEGDVYVESKVQKPQTEDAGALALAEAKRLVAEKTANARADTLKKHYKNIKLVAEANGACERLDAEMDKIEAEQGRWFKRRYTHDVQGTANATTVKVELADFLNVVNELRLATTMFCDRSGMNLTGKRDPANDKPDTRSVVECSLAILFCDSLVDCFAGIIHRLERLKIQEKRLQSTIPAVESLVMELRQRSVATMATFPPQKTPMRKLKLRADIEKEVKDQVNAEAGGGAAAAPAPADAVPVRPPNPMLASIRGGRTGRGRGGRGAPAGDDEGAPPARPDFLASIRGRGGRGGVPPAGDDDGPPSGGRGDFLSAIRGRGRGPPGGGDLLASIRGRGRGGRGDLFAAITSRKQAE
ncbi:hypothetical protein H310_04007 [Aphanomyces invadans]|uniref:PDZ domain-containing protein n=1 Tax=Aphanomyces invadans TaxID=157072 RepID=A0A024UFF7_9STRA|nr:hypothetical protein H310_04007 [Aphanomyces invadans]ETW04900.1 hypothetical protein H310_04007 [Aphanomyces invadans]|eukprot:XP_008866338.1 hypothetical protein H310_04007 [Aphanomyces invadans]